MVTDINDHFQNMLFLVKDDGVKKGDMEKVAVTVFEETDKDGNGHLTKDEFLEAFHRDKRVKELITVIFVAIAKSMKEVLDNHSQ